MSSNDIAVSVRGLSKSYTIAHNAEKHSTAAEALLHRLKNPFQRQEKETFWALKDVDFDIKKGDVVGIIGRNGAGKSTLLKILSRITEPTTGSIALYGRVGSLLEVGTGFHPELTGRENIFLSGAILGMSKREIAQRFDEIVDFAGVEKFIDTPVKRYSSGMYVRLAYAVAAHLSTDVLIVDEVLSVGDLQFQQKCLNHMRSLNQKGITVLLVSHNMAAIQSCCKSAMFLNKGRFICAGKPLDMIDMYRSVLQDNSYQESTNATQSEGAEVIITGFEMIGEDGIDKRNFKFGEAPQIRIYIDAKQPVYYPLINFGIKRGDGVVVCNFNNMYDNFRVEKVQGECLIEGWLPPMRLVPDYYEIHLLVWPWGGHLMGDMRGSAPLASGSFGDFSVEGVGLNSHDGIIQLPARKWRVNMANGIYEHTNITKDSLHDSLNTPLHLNVQQQQMLHSMIAAPDEYNISCKAD